MTPWTVACRAPLSMEFSRQEYWSGLPFHSAGVLPDPGTELVSPLSPALAGGFFTTRATWEVPCSWPSAGKCWNVMTNKIRMPALCWFRVCSGRQIRRAAVPALCEYYCDRNTNATLSCCSLPFSRGSSFSCTWCAFEIK